MPRKSKCIIQLASTLLLCLLYSLTYSQAKNTSPTKIYFQAATGATTYKGSSSELSIQGVFKNKWVTTLSYQSLDMKPKNLPGDYNAGTTTFIVTFNNATPGIEMKLINFTAGRYFKAGKNSWFTTEAGLSHVRGEKLKFTRTGSVNSNFFIIGGTSSNYSHTEEKKTGMGVMLKADWNWAFTSFIGVGAGMFANFNSIQSPVGFQLKLFVGKLNREKKHR